jgi:hypothetical protein
MSVPFEESSDTKGWNRDGVAQIEEHVEEILWSK